MSCLGNQSGNFQQRVRIVTIHLRLLGANLLLRRVHYIGTRGSELRHGHVVAAMGTRGLGEITRGDIVGAI